MVNTYYSNYFKAISQGLEESLYYTNQKVSDPDFFFQTWMYHTDIIGGLAAKLAGIKKIYWGVHSTYLNPTETKFLTKLAIKTAKYLSCIVPFKIICCSEVALKSH
jgi:hypothetical protein